MLKLTRNERETVIEREADGKGRKKRKFEEGSDECGVCKKTNVTLQWMRTG
jgi:hypothetical protein